MNIQPVVNALWWETRNLSAWSRGNGVPTFDWTPFPDVPTADREALLAQAVDVCQGRYQKILDQAETMSSGVHSWQEIEARREAPFPGTVTETVAAAAAAMANTALGTAVVDPVTCIAFRWPCMTPFLGLWSEWPDVAQRAQTIRDERAAQAAAEKAEAERKAFVAVAEYQARYERERPAREARELAQRRQAAEGWIARNVDTDHRAPFDPALLRYPISIPNFTRIALDGGPDWPEGTPVAEIENFRDENTATVGCNWWVHGERGTCKTRAVWSMLIRRMRQGDLPAAGTSFVCIEAGELFQRFSRAAKESEGYREIVDECADSILWIEEFGHDNLTQPQAAGLLSLLNSRVYSTRRLQTVVTTQYELGALQRKWGRARDTAKAVDAIFRRLQEFFVPVCLDPVHRATPAKSPTHLAPAADMRLEVTAKAPAAGVNATAKEGSNHAAP